jgi:tetratricopeptide (TPR) repeat protein
MMSRPTRAFAVPAGIVAALLLTPAPASAERSLFVQGLHELMSAVAGTFGDEGPQLLSALDKMAGGLERVEGSVRSLDADGTVQGPVLPYAAYTRGYALLEAREYRVALVELRRVALADPLLTDPAVHLESMKLAAAALRQGRLEDARRQFQAALMKVPNSSEAHRGLGLVYFAASRYDESVEQLRLAMQANPRDERCRVALAKVLVDTGRFSDAELALRDTIDAFPDSRVAHWWLASVYEHLKQVSDARRHLELAAASGVIAGRGRLWGSIGRLARIEGDFAGAITAFTRAVAANPNDSAAHNDLARAYAEQNQTEKALAEWRAALRIDPRDADAYAGLGQILLDTGRPDEAVTALERAMTLGPDNNEARYTLANALMRLGRTSEAARELEAFERVRQQMLEKQRRAIATGVKNEEKELARQDGSR